MLESLVRNNFERLRKLYDHAPSPARNVLTSARGWLLSRIRYSRRTLDFLRTLRLDEAWSAKEIAEHQLARLQETLAGAQKFVPHYRRYPTDLQSLEDLRRLPILSRETVRQDPEQFLSSTIAARQRLRAGTTGTTGANLNVAYSEETLAQNWAFLLRQWAWAHIPPRSPRVTLFGARVVPADRADAPFWCYNAPEHQLLLSIFHLSARTAPAYLNCLRQHCGEVLEGFPSVLLILADFAAQRGETFPMRAIFTSGEPLYPEARARIEEAFQSHIFDSYGMTEWCGLIQECEAGQMHLAPEYGFLEIVSDTGEPVTGNEEGHFLWTGFINPAMPLIRYRVGDRGRWQTEGACACGRAFPRVIPTVTRDSDMLHMMDGRIFSPRALNQLLKQTTALRFCQFVHDRHNRVVVRAVASGSRGAEDVMNVRARLQELLGSSTQVTAELSDAPISRKGGKIPLIVDQVPE
jgi:phenylacetate-coenzyme A ligase PaaK-like adenylate-forming protein